MTVQAGEVLDYYGENYSMRYPNLPFDAYLKTAKDLCLVKFSTSCYRGYYGKWKIEDDKLFLVSLRANRIDCEELAELKKLRDAGRFNVGWLLIGGRGTEIYLNDIFPNQEKVFAYWVTDKIKALGGEVLERNALHFPTLCEFELHLDIVEGKVVSATKIDNRSKKK